MVRKAACLALLLSLAGSAAAQAPAPDGLTPGRAELSRAQLEAVLQEYQATAGSGAYTAAYRNRTRAQVSLIRDRLENGDIQVGDRIDLAVENQPSLTSTFVVDQGRVLVLPAIGSIPLAGVLRSELEGYLTKQLSRYIVEPVVHAKSMVRLTIVGSVGKPGFYLVPAQSLIPDALMQAGGPASDADMNGLRITRNGRTIWDGKTLQNAIVQGWTLDQLSVQAGDQVEVGGKKASNWGNMARAMIMSVGPMFWMLRVLHVL